MNKRRFHQHNCGDDGADEEIHNFLLVARLNICQETVLQCCICSGCTYCAVDLARVCKVQSSHLLLKTFLTSTNVFVLEVPEHPECDCAAHKSNNEDTDDGIDDETGQKAEEEGDDEREDERHDAHLSELRPAVLQVPHKLLQKALCSTAAEQTSNHICLVRNGIGYTPGEKVFAEEILKISD